MGAQDDFPYALDFFDTTGVNTPTMLWDPSFATWQTFDVQYNSQMMVLAPDLTEGSNLIYGFDDGRQSEILDFARALAP